VAAPIQLQGGATLVQLKLVAAAFKLCPAPTEAQMHAVAQRVGLTPQRLEAWFQSRRTLEGWIEQQGGQVTTADVAATFYSPRPEA